MKCAACGKPAMARKRTKRRATPKTDAQDTPAADDDTDRDCPFCGAAWYEDCRCGEWRPG